ncbi:hypothetical protein Nepgr_022792 [Nepenthes gracilis]|uniref:Uncharacterized protein n=1 Tax=Nepenthes gracilis TaxID=150966 RepID=A0AAD3T1C3_NEPGR|nr:hypothetical protein Nepgr_022792 [Nepenthes gracilis]
MNANCNFPPATTLGNQATAFKHHQGQQMTPSVELHLPSARPSDAKFPSQPSADVLPPAGSNYIFMYCNIHERPIKELIARCSCCRDLVDALRLADDLAIALLFWEPTGRFSWAFMDPNWIASVFLAVAEYPAAGCLLTEVM